MRSGFWMPRQFACAVELVAQFLVGPLWLAASIVFAENWPSGCLIHTETVHERDRHTEGCLMSSLAGNCGILEM